jgi:hypothetical protein
MPAQNLGFYMPDYGLNVEEQPANIAQPMDDAEKVGQDQADAASEGYEQSILADLPEEAPVDCKEGEPWPRTGLSLDALMRPRFTSMVLHLQWSAVSEQQASLHEKRIMIRPNLAGSSWRRGEIED